MKRLIAVFLAAVVLIAGFPISVLAAPGGKELDNYLTEISWTKEELSSYLSDYYELTFDDFEDTADLRWFLGEELTPKTLKEVLRDYEVTEKEAHTYLVSIGELEEGQSFYDAFKFVDDLDFALYAISLTPVTDETMAELLKEFNLTYEELEALFAEYDDDISYYDYAEDLYYFTEYYLSAPEEYYDEDEDFFDLFGMIGLTDEELDRLFEHFLTLDVENEAFWLKLEELAERMLAFEYFDAAAEVTPEMIAELLSIFDELLDLLEMETSIYLVKGEEKKEISLASLVAMTTTDGYDLLIELYNLDGEFLADLLFTAEMFGAEIIHETGGDLKEVEKVIEQAAAPKEKPALAQETVKKEHTIEKETAVLKAPATEAPLMVTETGGRLPDTATNHLSNALLGLFLAAAGLFLFRQARVRNEAA